MIRAFLKNNFTFIVMCALISFSLQLFLSSSRLKKENTQLSRIYNLHKASKENSKLILTNFHYLGNVLDYNNLKLVNKISIPDSHHSHLMLFVNKNACDLCVKDEVIFLNEISNVVGENFARAVIVSDTERYSKSMTKNYGFNFPVYFDFLGTFEERNSIHHSPILFLVDKNNMILFAHSPEPGFPELSKPFHDFCRKFFGME